MPLSERELYCLYTKALDYDEKKALQYLKDHKYPMSHATYHRVLTKIGAETLKRLVNIAKDQKQRHLKRIEKLELIETLMWEQADKEGDATKKTRILKEIREHQLYLSAFDEATDGVIEEVVRKFGEINKEH